MQAINCVVSREQTEADQRPSSGPERPYYCYIVRCRDGSLYTGITNDLERRIAVHNQGKGAAYTASRRPVELVYSEFIGSKGDALRRELQIKSLPRARKLQLIQNKK